MLPTFQKAEYNNPRRLLLFSQTKTGKTTLLSGLDNCLIIDTEDGSGYIEGIKFNLLKESQLKGEFPSKILKDLAAEIQKKEIAYDYIAIDSITELEEIARKMSLLMYKDSLIGTAYKGDDLITDLAYGAGYDWLKKAFNILFNLFLHLPKKALILTGHFKPSVINKNGKELEAKDIQLSKRVRHIVCSNADAIGYIYRKKNEVYVTFKSHEQDLITGTRSPHLRNQEFVLSEYKDNKFIFHWDKIFIPE